MTSAISIYGHKRDNDIPKCGVLIWSSHVTVMSQLSTHQFDCRYCMPKYGDPVVQSNRSGSYAHCPYLGMPHLWPYMRLDNTLHMCCHGNMDTTESYLGIQ